MKYFFIALFCFALLPTTYAFPELVDCQGGTYSSFNAETQITTCINCPRGRYQPDRGQSSCIACEVGRYQDLEGQLACKECPPGTTTDDQGSVSIDACKSTDKVPAMSSWGLILLIGAVLGVAIFLLVRSGLSKE